MTIGRRLSVRICFYFTPLICWAPHVIENKCIAVPSPRSPGTRGQTQSLVTQRMRTHRIRSLRAHARRSVNLSRDAVSPHFIARTRLESSCACVCACVCERVYVCARVTRCRTHPVRRALGPGSPARDAPAQPAPHHLPASRHAARVTSRRTRHVTPHASRVASPTTHRGSAHARVQGVNGSSAHPTCTAYPTQMSNNVQTSKVLIVPLREQDKQ